MADVEPESEIVRRSISTNRERTQVEPLLLEKMMEPAFYPHPSPSVEPVQTLTGWLLFVGDFVYKVKKPVHFSFIDARTLAKRYRLCRDEVMVNRRLAPEVYLDITGITARSDCYEMVPNATLNRPGVREFAIVMNRLPRERILSQMVASQTVGVLEIQQLGQKLASFHLDCSVAKSKPWGSAAALSRLIGATVAGAGEFIADTVMRGRLAVAARYLRGYVVDHQRLFDDRARSGRVREGNGDLRADSVCLIPQALAIIGSVEYSKGLRYCDVASELASVMLDLEVAGRNDLSDALVQAYIVASDDAELAELIPFYKCYRAVRRGQLEMLTSLQTEMPRERRMLARHYASRWFELAEHIAS
jgi:uncharacterized protein